MSAHPQLDEKSLQEGTALQEDQNRRVGQMHKRGSSQPPAQAGRPVLWQFDWISKEWGGLSNPNFL